jgi:hypothetical protein
MAALTAEFEQKFIEVLISRAVTTLRLAAGALDPHPSRRPYQDGYSPPRGQRRDLRENASRLAPSLALPAQSRTGAIAGPLADSFPYPALCRPPTSHWRAGAHVDVGRPRHGWSSHYGGTLRRGPRPAALVV